MSQPQSDQGKQAAQCKGNAPSPRHELRIADHARNACNDSGRHQRACPRPHLGPCRVQSAPTGMAMLHPEQHRPRPFAAEGYALHQPQHDKDKRTDNAHGMIGGQNGDQPAQTPMQTTVSVSTLPRPSLSPSRPNTTPPSGRDI